MTANTSISAEPHAGIPQIRNTATEKRDVHINS